MSDIPTQLSKRRLKEFGEKFPDEEIRSYLVPILIKAYQSGRQDMRDEVLKEMPIVRVGDGDLNILIGGLQEYKRRGTVDPWLLGDGVTIEPLDTLIELQELRSLLHSLLHSKLPAHK